MQTPLDLYRQKCHHELETLLQKYGSLLNPEDKAKYLPDLNRTEFLDSLIQFDYCCSLMNAIYYVIFSTGKLEEARKSTLDPRTTLDMMSCITGHDIETEIKPILDRQGAVTVEICNRFLSIDPSLFTKIASGQTTQKDLVENDQLFSNSKSRLD